MLFFCFCAAKNNNGNSLSKKTDPPLLLTFSWYIVEYGALGIGMLYFNLKVVLSSLLRIYDKLYIYRLILEGLRIFRSCFASAIVHLDYRWDTRKDRQFSWFYTGFLYCCGTVHLGKFPYQKEGSWICDDLATPARCFPLTLCKNSFKSSSISKVPLPKD